MEGKPTPGPWKWINTEPAPYTPIHQLVGTDPEYPEHNRVVIDDGSAGGEYNPSIDVAGPDTRLIAAAPDLLAACKEALTQLLCGPEMPWDVWEAYHPAMNKMRAAIAKAEGEG